MLGCFCLELDFVGSILYTELSGIALHIVKREVLRKADADRHLAYRLFPFRQEHIEVEHVLRAVVVTVLTDPVFDRIDMSAFRKLLSIGDHYLACFRGGLCLIQHILHLYFAYPEISARYRKLNTLQLIRDVYAYLLFNGIGMIFTYCCSQIVIRYFECPSLDARSTDRCVRYDLFRACECTCCKR